MEGASQRRGYGGMKAAIYTKYGPPGNVVQIAEVEKPVPRDNEVLIKVRAASINPLDWRFMRGRPAIGRLAFGLRKPKITRPGVDVGYAEDGHARGKVVIINA